MSHPRPQFRAKADLPVGFPYRFNSSCVIFLCLSFPYNSLSLSIAIDSGLIFSLNTIEFSAAAFEVAKTKISSLVQSAEFKRENECKPETSKDKQGAIVETRLKVYSKSKQKFRNNFGAHKYTINYYNTTSTMLVNGSRLDLFETHILQPLYDHIQENSNRIGEMNLQLGNALCTVLAPTLPH